MADTFGCPTADGVDDFGWTFNSTEAIPQAMPEGVDDASIRHTRLQPFVQRRAGRVGIALGFAAIFGKGEGGTVFQDPLRCP